MEQPQNDNKTGLPQPHVTNGVVFVQFVLGLLLHCVLALPFLRRTHGLERLRPQPHQLLVINHVSLLDTLLIAA